MTGGAIGAAVDVATGLVEGVGVVALEVDGGLTAAVVVTTLDVGFVVVAGAAGAAEKYESTNELAAPAADRYSHVPTPPADWIRWAEESL